MAFNAAPRATMLTSDDFAASSRVATWPPMAPAPNTHTCMLAP